MKRRNLLKNSFIAVFLVITLVACGPSEEEINAAATLIAAEIFATQTASAPTATPTEAATDTATATLPPTETNTPRPTAVPTRTSIPPTAAQPSSSSCTDSSGGKHKVRVENRTGANATLYFYGPENVICSIASGVNLIYILPGYYSVSGRMCGANYQFEDGVINNTWKLVLRCQ